MPNLVKGLGDRGFSGGDTVSRLDFLNQIGLVGEIEVVKSNLCIDVWQGLSVKTKRWLFFLGLSNQRMPIPPLMTPSRESLNFPMWIERKLGMDIDPSAYPECWK